MDHTRFRVWIYQKNARIITVLRHVPRSRTRISAFQHVVDGIAYPKTLSMLPRRVTKIGKSHCCAPITATFSKRRKIGSMWSEHCDVKWALRCAISKRSLKRWCIWIQIQKTSHTVCAESMLPRRVSHILREWKTGTTALMVRSKLRTKSPNKNWNDYRRWPMAHHISCHTDKNRYYTWS